MERIAHLGASGEHPEYTLVAIERAIGFGATASKSILNLPMANHRSSPLCWKSSTVSVDAVC